VGLWGGEVGATSWLGNREQKVGEGRRGMQVDVPSCVGSGSTPLITLDLALK